MGSCCSKPAPKPHRPPPANATPSSEEYQQYQTDMSLLDKIFNPDTPHVNHLPFFNPEHRSLLLLQDILDRRDEIDSALVAEKILWYITHFCGDPDFLEQATKYDVFDLIVNRCGAKYVGGSSPDQGVAKLFLSAVMIMTGNNPEGQKLFSNAETLHLIFNILEKIGNTVPEVSVGVASTICNFAKENEVGQSLLSNNAEFVHPIVAAFSRFPNHIQNVMEFSNAIVAICSEKNKTGQLAFSTVEFAEAVHAAFEHILTGEDTLTKYPTPEHRVRRLCKCVRHIVDNNNAAGLNVFATPEFVETMTQVQSKFLNETSTTNSSFTSASYEDEYIECLKILSDEVQRKYPSQQQQEPTDE